MQTTCNKGRISTGFDRSILMQFTCNNEKKSATN